MAWAKRLLQRFESYFLGKVPLYAFFRSMFSEMSGQYVETGPIMALAWIDWWQPAAVMEELENGWIVVFVPQAPTPFSGGVYYMPPDRVIKIEATKMEMFKAVTRFGVGSRALLKGQPLEPMS